MGFSFARMVGVAALYLTLPFLVPVGSTVFLAKIASNYDKQFYMYGSDWMLSGMVPIVAVYVLCPFAVFSSYLMSEKLRIRTKFLPFFIYFVFSLAFYFIYKSTFECTNCGIRGYVMQISSTASFFCGLSLCSYFIFMVLKK